MFTIRKMMAHEIETVLSMWDANCRECLNIGLNADGSRVLEHLRKNIDSRDAACLVAEEEETGDLFGFITCFAATHPAMQGTLGQIDELYVMPDARRQGAGTELVRDAVEFLRELGADTIRTEVELENTSAQNLLRNLGWDKESFTYKLYD